MSITIEHGWYKGYHIKVHDPDDIFYWKEYNQYREHLRHDRITVNGSYRQFHIFVDHTNQCLNIMTNNISYIDTAKEIYERMFDEFNYLNQSEASVDDPLYEYGIIISFDIENKNITFLR